MAATVATSIFISREGLRASSQSTVSEFANMKLLCFGKADATLYREIASFKVLDPEQRVHKEPGSELEGISFSALYFRTYSHLYSAHLEECRLNVAKLVDQLFGRGAMRRLAESFNQECLHFFHDVVAEEAVKHHRIKGGFFIQNTREVLLLRVGKDRLQLKILNQLESIQGPGLQKIPLDAQTIVHARVLKSGIDVLGVNIRGLQAHLVSDFLMGKQFKRPLWKDMLKKAQHNPFKAMMLLASCAGMSAYGALLMGAEMEPLARIADLDGNAFEGFVSLLLTFQGAGMLSYFAARGARLVTAEWREKLEPMWVALKRIRQTRGHEDAIDEPGTVSELMILANEMNRPDSPLFYDKKRNASLTPTSCSSESMMSTPASKLDSTSPVAHEFEPVPMFENPDQAATAFIKTLENAERHLPAKSRQLQAPVVRRRHWTGHEGRCQSLEESSCAASSLEVSAAKTPWEEASMQERAISFSELSGVESPQPIDEPAQGRTYTMSPSKEPLPKDVSEEVFAIEL